MTRDNVRFLELFESCSGLDGVQIGEGAFAPGPALWVGTREVAHVDADGSLDVRLTRQVISRRRAELRADQRVSMRPSTSDWIEIRVGGGEDIGVARSLIEDAIAANLASAPAGLPPTGRDLERRRRFH